MTYDPIPAGHENASLEQKVVVERNPRIGRFLDVFDELVAEAAENGIDLCEGLEAYTALGRFAKCRLTMDEMEQA